MNRHDNKSKTVLGKRFPGNDGYREGVTLLSMLARHPSTAAFISRKLAVRFVSDDPPAALVEKMAQSFIEQRRRYQRSVENDGLLQGIWSCPHCVPKPNLPLNWDQCHQGIAGKSDCPIPGVQGGRQDGPEIIQLRATDWLPLISCLLDKFRRFAEPHEFRDGIGEGQQARGISYDLLALNQNHEPESATDALLTYSRLFLPERDLGITIKRLTPLLTEPDYAGRLNAEAGKNREKGSGHGRRRTGHTVQG